MLMTNDELIPLRMVVWSCPPQSESGVARETRRSTGQFGRNHRYRSFHVVHSKKAECGNPL